MIVTFGRGETVSCIDGSRESKHFFESQYDAKMGKELTC